MDRFGWKARGVSAVAALLALTGCMEWKRDAAPAPAPVANAPASGSPDARQDGAIPYKEPEIVADKLNVPWDMAFAPDGRLFFTERPGAIRLLASDGKLQAEPVFAFTEPPFVSRGEGGLLGLALDPDFAKNGYLYAYHSYEMNGAMKNRVLRLVVEGSKARLDRVLLADLPGQRNHDGGRIRFGPDGMLYVTVGDAEERELSQAPGSLAGKILRLMPDGTVPADNPDPKSPVWSMGHRNPQGLAWQPGAGKLFSSEHGQTYKDEINVIEKGANYGWPLIEGDQTEPKQPVPSGTPLRKPLVHSGSDSWAPSGMTFVTQGPWKGRLLVAGLRGEQVLMVTLDPGSEPKVERTESLWKGRFGRLRNVVEGPDGSLYVFTNNRDGRGTPKPGDDKLLRFRPE
ncbi:PQQ-dependent sugar dehydrogenase [Paenibacillus flagellatus]|uniref:Glucose sorbosone dehydrogenase n=1 Tax=Paenibacillus flagellatus TaxID=2211139 RepID=A0A2V5JZN6_9BACL|nr:PQQ-dependent sugar dehydrogenase [Paenibacillus flagellatus]PYI51762.1 glucose sorbosone dehydrogenase [Paenibacillus flagellatus]